MIPDIGLMVGTYIITRMLQIIMKRDPKENAIVVVLAVVTILATILGLLDLLTRGSSNPLQ